MWPLVGLATGPAKIPAWAESPRLVKVTKRIVFMFSMATWISFTIMRPLSRGCFIPNDALYLSELQQRFFNDGVGGGPINTYPSPAITVHVEKNVHSALLDFQVIDAGPSLIGHLFCDCVSGCADEI